MSRSMYVSVSDIQHDTDQVRVYNLKKDKRYIVDGCAGSGKSSLALLLLQRILAESGEQDDVPTPVYYVTTVHELVECVRQQFTSFTPPPKYNDYAITGGEVSKLEDGKGSNWASGFISDLQRKNQVPRGAYCINSRRCMLEQKVVQREYEGVMRSFINENIRINTKPEYLLVDEAQDFSKDRIEEFLKSASKGCVFYGDDTQCIMDFANPMHLEDLELFLKRKYGEFDASGKAIIYRYTSLSSNGRTDGIAILLFCR